LASSLGECHDAPKGKVMRAFFVVSLLSVLLSGCAVAEVAGAGVSVATTVVTTTVDVAGDVVSGVADTVSGKDEKKKPDKGDDEDDK
jgi:hypothetical protein